MTPYFNNFHDFIQMGEHGFYVWLCWGLVLGSVFIGVILIKDERKKLIKELKIAQARKNNQSKK